MIVINCTTAESVLGLVSTFRLACSSHRQETEEISGLIYGGSEDQVKISLTELYSAARCTQIKIIKLFQNIPPTSCQIMLSFEASTRLEYLCPIRNLF